VADQPGTFERVAQALGVALQPLEILLAPENLPLLLAELGLDAPPSLVADNAFLQKLSEASNKSAVLGPQLDLLAEVIDQGDAQKLLDAAGQLMQAITQVFTALDAIATDFKRAATGALDPAELAKFAGDMAERITENLLVRYLESFHQVAWQLLSLFTIIEYDAFEITVGTNVQRVLRRRLYFEKIGPLFSNPLALLSEAYGWGTDAFDGKRLFAQTAGLANVLGLLGDNVTAANGTAVFDLFAITFAPTPKTNALPPGIEGTLYVDLAESSDITIAQLSETSHIALRLSGTFGAGLVFRLLPPTKIEVDGGANVAGDVEDRALRRPLSIVLHT